MPLRCTRCKAQHGKCIEYKKCLLLGCDCHLQDATHPDAKLHVLAAVDLHAFIQQANLLKVLPVDHKAANQSRAPEMERGKPEERLENRGKKKKKIFSQFYKVCFSPRQTPEV